MTIGTCPKPAGCKHDCDCRKLQMVCAASGANANTCQPLRRLSKCVACGSKACKKGEPCFNPNDTLSACK